MHIFQKGDSSFLHIQFFAIFLQNASLPITPLSSIESSPFLQSLARLTPAPTVDSSRSVVTLNFLNLWVRNNLSENIMLTWMLNDEETLGHFELLSGMPILKIKATTPLQTTPSTCTNPFSIPTNKKQQEVLLRSQPRTQQQAIHDLQAYVRPAPRPPPRPKPYVRPAPPRPKPRPYPIYNPVRLPSPTPSFESSSDSRSSSPSPSPSPSPIPKKSKTGGVYAIYLDDIPAKWDSEYLCKVIR